jgi:bloom syndrome protein
MNALHLVTKPFASTFGLSKPFRPPSFIRPQVGLVQSAPIPAAAEEPQIMVATREPSVDLDLSEQPDEDNTEETEDRGQIGSQLRSVSPVIDLPDVDILWQPIYSTKVPVSFKSDLMVILLITRNFRLKNANSSLKS